MTPGRKTPGVCSATCNAVTCGSADHRTQGVPAGTGIMEARRWKRPGTSMLADVAPLIAVHHNSVPEPFVTEQCVAFGPSRHRGCASRAAFDKRHILAASQAVYAYLFKEQ